MRRMLFGVIAVSSGLFMLIGIPKGRMEGGDSRYLPGHFVGLGLGLFLFGAGIYFLIGVVKVRVSARKKGPNNKEGEGDR